ncbi:MAG TPA: hydroxyisourate hydrolase [Terracidiphilus sp.]|jgi:5-hydroxyisourate hydrolase|nr:hydroxyisourate hydrolase [Terracidiphilus sp.]
MSGITTHVLDTALGKPAAGVAVHLEKLEGDQWKAIASASTDTDGRCRELAEDARQGLYRLTFDTEEYFRRNRRTSIYPQISITFVCSGNEHYHLPVLLSDNSYTTYRGS